MSSERVGSGSPRHERLPRRARIRKGIEIRHLLREGRRIRGAHLDIFTDPAPEQGPRFGTIVPKHRHSGVERNRLQRRLREIGRIEVLPRLRQASRSDAVLVRARPSAYAVPFSALHTELVRITEGLCSDASSSD